VTVAVVATAGHVDHGKSALVRRLTGQEPDRLAMERQRGLTLDLGHTHLVLPSGRSVGVVDVPGHERYLGTTVSGIGPAGGVLFCVAADEGWSVQSEQHARACVALGLDGARVVLVITKTDRGTDPTVAGTAAGRLLRLGLEPRAVVGCSALHGDGLPAVVTALDELVRGLPTEAPNRGDRPRLWVDRSFTLPGAGTVVTGTLPVGTLRRGDAVLTAAGASRIRRLQRYGADVEEVTGPDRVAVNLVGLSTADVPRGTALVRGDSLDLVERPDVVVTTRFDERRWPRSTLLSFGTATLSARLGPTPRGFRVTLPEPQALREGDHLLVRDPGGRVVLGGLRVAVGQLGPDRASTAPAPRPEPAGDSALLAHLAEHPLDPPPPDRLAAWGVSGAALRRLAAAGEITYLGRGLAFGPDLLLAVRAVLERLPEEFTVGELREALGLSRAHTLVILEHTDRSGLTERLPSGRRAFHR
jgi:selenocysteine-specific translation elongation factor